MLNIRIIRWELKLLYVVGAIVFSFTVAALLRAVNVAEVVVQVVTSAVDIAALVFGARVFRGRGEAIEPPRAWWRMTARPKLSLRLGILFVVALAIGVISYVQEAIGVPVADGLTAGERVISDLRTGVFAYFYVNSTVRLKRLGVPPVQPRFRPTISLKR